MGSYLQIIAGTLVAVILGLALNKQGKDIALLIMIGVCCMVLVGAAAYLEPVLDFIESLKDIGGLDSQWIGIMLKAVGIGLIAELAALICSDSGNGALARTIQILASAAVLWLSIPLMRSLIQLIQRILGEL